MQLRLGLLDAAPQHLEDILEAEHEHGFSMCVHPDDQSRWHVACAADDCNVDHFTFGAMELISCAYCGSPLHYAVHCDWPQVPTH